LELVFLREMATTSNKTGTQVNRKPLLAESFAYIAETRKSSLTRHAGLGKVINYKKLRIQCFTE